MRFLIACILLVSSLNAFAEDPRLESPSVEERRAALAEHVEALAEFRRVHLNTKHPVKLLAPLYQALRDKDLSIAMPAFNWVELYSYDKEGSKLFERSYENRAELSDEIARRVTMRMERNQKLRGEKAQMAKAVSEKRVFQSTLFPFKLFPAQPPADSSPAFRLGFSGVKGMTDALSSEKPEERRQAVEGFFLYLSNARLKSRTSEGKMKTPSLAVPLLRELSRDSDPVIAGRGLAWLSLSLGVCHSVTEAEDSP